MPYRSVASSAVFHLEAGLRMTSIRLWHAQAMDRAWSLAGSRAGHSATGGQCSCCTGSRKPRGRSKPHAAALNRFGWNVAALDSRGHGQSEGHYSTFGGLEAQDIQAWFDELAGRLARTDTAPPFSRCSGAAPWVRPSLASRRPRFAHSGPGARVPDGRSRRVDRSVPAKERLGARVCRFRHVSRLNDYNHSAV